MSLADYMAVSLLHPEHGYYARKAPIGEQGDFITAPETSQMFGELIGLWCLSIWYEAGCPSPIRLVELGPGRGTMMADILRTACRDPGFRASVEVHLVEIGEAHRAAQKEQLGKMPVSLAWHDDLQGIPEAPAFILANEFFDALPVRQFEYRDGTWQERLVDIDAGRLVLRPAGGGSPLAAMLPPGEPGQVAELSTAGLAVADEIARRMAAGGLAALIVDYGYDRAPGRPTLQALSGHRQTDILSRPGEADLTAHVDFTALARCAAERGARSHGVVTQRVFLEALGIGSRAEQLKSGKPPETAARIDRQLQRLTAASEMGDLFKALAICHPQAPFPPGFPAEPAE